MLTINPAFSQKIDKAEQTAIDATPEQVAAQTLVKDDPMETIIEVNTEPFYQHRFGFLKILTEDKYVRAFIDKKTLAVTYQAYFWFTYSGKPQDVVRANILTASGPESAEVHELRNNVQTCTQFGCVKREDLAVDVPEAVFRWVASGAKAGSGEDWLVRLGTQEGESGNQRILKTEVAGLLLAVDARLKTLQAKSQTNPPPHP